jgi:hypothetical protein
MQDEKGELFYDLLDVFQKLALLDDLILVGSWCHLFFRTYFQDPLAVDGIRTSDVDFLITNPNKGRPERDVPAALMELGFITQHSFLSGWTKYVHKDLELEFLTPKRGTGAVQTLSIKPLKLEAHTIRFLDFLQDHAIAVTHAGFTVRVPEPAAYVLHKFLINPRRNEIKRGKDLETITKLSAYMVRREGERERFCILFAAMPKGWQKTILKVTKEHASWLNEVLIST